LSRLFIWTPFLEEFLNWKAFLDVFLMGTLVFLFYRTFRGLGTWRVFLGILISITVLVIASLLQLEGMTWVYSNLTQVALLGVIVIFQPEIRKVFERTVSLARNKSDTEKSGLPDMLADALFALSEQKRGAIIVLPGKESVRQWISGGFVVDAKPSLPLIMSIFDPHSPGHDGALIIKNGKVAWFGTRLPVSKSNDLPSEYGTRHNAALGLTEVTDALVLVVSEERGNITCFCEGKIIKIKDKEALRERIETHWERASSYIPKGENKRYKWQLGVEICSSLFLATIFWFFLIAANTQISEKTVVLPIEYTSIPQHLALVSNKSNQSTFHLAGPKAELDAFATSRSSIKIDLSKAMAGKQTLAINEGSIQLPKRVRILAMDPSSLSITLEEILLEEAVIKPQLVGKLPSGLEIKSIEVTPKYIHVLVPKGANRKGDIRLITTPIYLEGFYEDTTLFCKVIAPPHIQPAGNGWSDVQVDIRVTAPSKASSK
jgi:diadenylate cyclase